MNRVIPIFAVAVFVLFWHRTERWIRLRKEADAIRADELKLKTCDRCGEDRAKERNYCPNCGIEQIKTSEFEQQLNIIQVRQQMHDKKWESWRIPAKTVR